MLITAVSFGASLVILAEALNKLERTNVFAPGQSRRDRCTAALKVIAWVLLGLGAGGGLAEPLLQGHRPSLPDACVLAGFATLIVRSRIKEG